MSSDARRRPGLKKVVAQAGVIIFTLQLLGPAYLPFLQILTGSFTLPLYLWLQLGIILLVVAALIPAGKDEVWGSIWPLAGYDNAIDAIYTRGPWWLRFEELDENEKRRYVAAAMGALFGAV